MGTTTKIAWCDGQATMEQVANAADAAYESAYAAHTAHTANEANAAAYAANAEARKQSANIVRKLIPFAVIERAAEQTNRKGG
jgi:hypothetical protein